MKLTKSLKAAIVKQFKDGARVDYLADLYKQPMLRIEQVIRIVMIATEGSSKVQPFNSSTSDPALNSAEGAVEPLNLERGSEAT